MDTPQTTKPEYVYLLETSDQQTLAFLCQYRLFSKVSEMYRKSPKENMILNDFHDMEIAFEKGESLEMIRGIYVRRVPLVVAY
jgi:hypothetical protein